MPRINPTISQEAFEAIKKIPKNDRGKFVSLAIVRYEAMQDTDERLENLERRLKELEGKK
jgi:polyhydroxyalkanoate synthesis regulator phasin